MSPPHTRPRQALLRKPETQASLLHRRAKARPKALSDRDRKEKERKEGGKGEGKKMFFMRTMVNVQQRACFNEFKQTQTYCMGAKSPGLRSRCSFTFLNQGLTDANHIHPQPVDLVAKDPVPRRPAALLGLEAGAAQAPAPRSTSRER